MKPEVEKYLDMGIKILQDWKTSGKIPPGVLVQMWMPIDSSGKMSTLSISDELSPRDAHYYALVFLRNIEQMMRGEQQGNIRTEVIA